MLDRLLTDENRTSYRVVRAGVFLVAAVCLGAMLLLASAVVRDIRELRSARTDLVQWTLSQVEIEFLDFYLTLEQATTSDAPDLSMVRKDFDVFYSRVNIIANGTAFSDARTEQAFGSEIDLIVAFLDRTVIPIDAPDPVLKESLVAVAEDAKQLRSSVRGLYISGLAYFADSSDTLRNGLATRLLQLSALTGVLILIAALLISYSRVTNQRLSRRSRALGQANQRMETILSTSLDAVIVSDANGRVVDFNPAAERIFGYKLSNVKGKTIGELIVPPALREAHETGMKRMIETGQKRLVGHGHIQIDAQRSDGTIFPVELALESASSEDGELVIAFLRDISARVRTETDLRKARDSALAGEKAKAEFLNVMSHEIRTPLNGLLGNLNLLSETRMSREQKQFQNNMEISGKLLMKHVNSILDIARFESGKLPVRERVFQLGRLLQEIVDSMSGQAESKSIALRWTWAAEPIDWVKSDKEHVERILLNLVGNAIKFTEHGRVDIEAERQGSDIEFRVSDTGIGIAEDRQARIFDDFESHGPSSGGTGLGLGIARRIAHLLGGEIGVESTLDEGSVFWVRLPLEIAEEPTEEQTQDDQDAPSTALSILLAEDNEMNAFVAQHMLENQGHSVAIAEDGLQAVKAAEERKFDVILMDINMPKMDGLEATKRIRSDVDLAKDTPILAFSANVLPEDKSRFLANGMDGFVGKPIQPEELAEALDAVARGRLRHSSEKSHKEIAGAQARELLGDQYPKFLSRFIAESDDLIDWIAGGNAAIDTAIQRCHKLVSTAAMFGCTDYRKALSAAETAGKSGDLGDTLEDVCSSWHATKASLLDQEAV